MKYIAPIYQNCLYKAVGKHCLVLIFLLMACHTAVQAKDADLFLKVEIGCGDTEGHDKSAGLLGKSRRDFYTGEYLTYDVLLYTTLDNVAKVQQVVVPDFNSLTVLNGAVSNRGAIRTESVKGMQYKVYLIERYFIKSDKSGRYNIAGGEYAVSLAERQQYNDFFWGPTYRTVYKERRVESDGMKISIKALPEAKDGFDFSGAVGEFEIESWLPKGGIYTDKEAIMMIRISGFGDLANAKVPAVIKAFGKYASFKSMSRTEQVVQRDGRYYSEMILECRFLPKSSDGEIGSISFCYFDTETGKYRVIESDVLKWHDNNMEKDTELVPEVYGV